MLSNSNTFHFIFFNNLSISLVRSRCGHSPVNCLRISLDWIFLFIPTRRDFNFVFFYFFHERLFFSVDFFNSLFNNISYKFTSEELFEDWLFTLNLHGFISLEKSDLVVCLQRSKTKNCFLLCCLLVFAWMCVNETSPAAALVAVLLLLLFCCCFFSTLCSVCCCCL